MGSTRLANAARASSSLASSGIDRRSQAVTEATRLGVVLDPVQQAHQVEAQVDVGDEVHRHALRDGPDLDVAALVHEPQLVPERGETA